MQDIYLTERKIKKLEPLSDKSYGAYGKCYRYNGGVLKVFYDAISSRIESAIDKNIKRDSEIIFYPRSKLYMKSFSISRLKGYYMDEAPGINLLTLRNNVISGKQDLTFEELLSIYYDCFIPKLRKEDILMDDLKLSHIFIDDNFYFTDTDLYMDGLASDSSIYEENLSQVNSLLFGFLGDIGEFFRYDYECVGLSEENYFYRQISEIKRITGNSVNTLREFCEYKRRW